MDVKTAKLYAQLKPYKALVNKTSGFIRWALERVNNPYVACSFGKDSSVMLHLILQHDNKIPVRFLKWKGESNLIHNYDEIEKWWIDHYRINYQPYILYREKISYLMKKRFSGFEKNYDSYFVGLRKKESVGRRISIKKLGMFYKTKRGFVRITPMADWSEKDIAVYILDNNIKLISDYDEGFHVRTTARIPTDDMQARKEWLIRLKNNNISKYNEIVKKFPELKLYE